LNHLPPGAEPLEKVQGFCRAALFELWPSRRVKQQVIDLLRQRGLQEEQQAAVVAKLLAELVRVQGRAGFERALADPVRIQLGDPTTATALNQREGVSDCA